MTKYDVDLFIIGAGSGGRRAALTARSHSATVALAEKQEFGGTCVNLGCIPKKLMTFAAGYEGAMQDAAGYGWSVGDRSLDWKHFVDKKKKFIEGLNARHTGVHEKAGVDIHWGAAEIIDPHTVKVNDKTVTAQHILIGTGGKPAMLDIEGAHEYGLTSDDMFCLQEIPKRMVVVGVGYIGLEFAGIFNQLGTKIDVILRRKTILNEDFDEDVRTFLQQEMIKKGINFHPKSNVTKVEKQNNGLKAHLDTGEIIETDQILFATGRTPNTDGLGLENVGIELDKSGAIPVNKDDQTTVPSIYAIGDVTNRVALTPVAIREGQALANRLFGNKRTYLSYENIPAAVFSTPNASTVGLTEKQAREKYPDDIDIYKTDFRAMKMTIADNEERTLMKLVVQRSTDKVIGLHMVGENAGEIVQGFATAIIAGATKTDFDNTVAIHPVVAEEFVTMREKTA